MKNLIRSVSCLALAACSACSSDRDSARYEADAQQRMHGWMEALPMPPAPAADQTTRTHRDPLLDRLSGKWAVSGQLDGKSVKLDLTAGWTANADPLHLRLVSREKSGAGVPIYEATADLLPNPSGRDYHGDIAERHGSATGRWRGTGLLDDRDRISFQLFEDRRDPICLTLSLDASEDEWGLVVDDLRGGWTERVATLVMRRPKRVPPG